MTTPPRLDNATTTGSDSYKAVRIQAGIGALFFTALVLLGLLGQLRDGFDSFRIAAALVFAFVATVGWWIALRCHISKSRARMKTALLGGVVVGGVGFAAGFFGPIIFMPNSNQGPLLGIFVTGPLGFILGIVIGWLYGCFRFRQ